MNPMIFWVLILIMTVAAVMCVLLPLSRKEVVATGESRADVYKGQLQELELEGGVADGQERARIGRRLLSAREQSESGGGTATSGRASLVAASLGALVFIPGFTAGMYLTFGTPNFDVVEQASTKTPIEQQSVEQLVAAAEKQLEKDPDDLRGWTVVASVYGRTGQFAKRAKALSEILRISGPSASLFAELGEARALSNDGIVSQQTVATLQEAVKLEPKNLKARAYLLLAAEQEGKFDAALTGWKSLLTDAGDEKVWQDRIGERIAALQNRIASRSQSGPSKEQVEETATLAPDEQQAMIENMVAGLAQRLDDDPDDIDNWLRLLRSYHVLGKRDEMKSAWQKSTAFFASKPEAKARLMAVAKELGYSVGEDGALQGGVSQ